MFDSADEADQKPGWWDSWTKTEKPSCRNCGVQYEGNPNVESVSDSIVRYIVGSDGMTYQVISCEPLGHPRVALHQNHYAAPTSPGTPLGSIDFKFRDEYSASMTSFVDQMWTANSHPSGFVFKVTPPGSVSPNYPVLSMRADGRVAFGAGPSALSNPLVSVGMYRRGIFELPSVDNYMDLLKGNGSPFVNGAIVYAKDRDEILVSKGGEWHAIVTEPISRMPRREMGQPRKDGQPAIFGPRMPTPRGTDQMSKAWIV